MTEHVSKKTGLQKPTIAITMGDPCGIGPEVIAKALCDPGLDEICRLFVIGDLEVMRHQVTRFAPQKRMIAIEKVSEAIFQRDCLNILDIGSDERKAGRVRFEVGVMSADAARAALASITLAAKLALRGEIDAITTAPINKEAMKRIGFSFPGHTEFFAEHSHTKQFGMMMAGSGMKIMLASIHLPLADAISGLDAKKLFEIIHLTHHSLKRDFGLVHPKIAVAGLNPHAGENGIIGKEEIEHVRPAIKMAQTEGFNVSGPYPADTLFFKLHQGQFDAAVALYHDQALIPIKLLAFGGAVNITVGLPFIRTSVDHGTAFDIAGQGIADSGSLVEALRWAVEMARHRLSGACL